MEFFTDNILIIMFLPLWVSLLIIVNSLTSLTDSKRLTTVLTLFSTGIGLIFSLGLMWMFMKNNSAAIEDNVVWFNSGGLNFYLGILIDKISALFLIVLMSISLIVQLYSHGYMSNDSNFSRYYVYLNFFNFSMAGLILSSNLIQTYLFWELVGISSYLLIGFWLKKYSASQAAQKAFIVNRIGDCGFLIGIIVLIYFSVNYTNISGSQFLAFSNMQELSEQVYAISTDFVFYLVCILLFLGAMAKSAQFPLHVWLADAMEAPTPISALIHAATMVAAGIYLTVRLYPLFIMSSAVMDTILYIGLFTALVTAFFALTQTDVKRMLAYSTSSQLGLMFVGLGILAPSAALFHLSTHAFYKALLFLCAGIVIKYVHNTQNMKHMGGLRKHLPLCAICYLIGAFALSGICFSGFSSKESLIFAIYQKHSLPLLVTFLLISFMSAFYIFKSYFMIFEGKEKNEFTPKVIPVSMNLSIIILAIPSIILGYLLSKNFESFINPLGLAVESVHNHILVALSIGVALFGMFLAVVLFKFKKHESFFPSFIYKLSYNTFYINQINSWVINNVFLRLCRVQSFFDKYIVDGFVNLVGLFTRFMSWIVSKLQNGNVQTYISYSIFFIGTMLLSIVGFYFWLLKG